MRQPTIAQRFTAALALLICLALSPAAPAAAPEPTKIAVIDLEKVSKALNEWTDRETERKARAEGYQKQLDEMSGEITKIEDNMKIHPQGPEGDKGREQDAIKRLKQIAATNAQKDINQQLVDLDKGKLIGQMYKKVIKAAAEVAEQQGYDIVLSDTSAIDPGDRGTDREIASSILQRQLIYVNPKINITEQVINKMNAEYGAPKVPAGAAPAAPTPPAPPKPAAPKPAAPAGKK